MSLILSRTRGSGQSLKTVILIQMHILPPALPAHHEIGKKGHTALWSLG